MLFFICIVLQFLHKEGGLEYDQILISTPFQIICLPAVPYPHSFFNSLFLHIMPLFFITLPTLIPTLYFGFINTFTACWLFSSHSERINTMMYNSQARNLWHIIITVVSETSGVIKNIYCQDKASLVITLAWGVCANVIH